MGGIRILTDSPMTTVQDAGRFGLQGVGVHVSGPADPDAHALAQLLVGNDARAAGLELTLTGPAIEFTQDNNIALTGGDFGPRLDGMPISCYRALRVCRGQVLTFDGRRSGFRAYLAFSGGLDVPLTMGSRATHLPSGMGGLEGRKLYKGDELGFLCPAAPYPVYPCRAAVPLRIDDGIAVLRVVLGPQADRFTPAGIQTFLSSPYQVLSQSDRMGYRLNGERIEHVGDGNILSDGIPFGAVQVPDSGQPIIMLADRQTTGGYAKIACVISADYSKIAQKMAGEWIRFEAVRVECAQQLRCEQLRRIETLKSYF